MSPDGAVQEQTPAAPAADSPSSGPATGPGASDQTTAPSAAPPPSSDRPAPEREGSQANAWFRESFNRLRSGNTLRTHEAPPDRTDRPEADPKDQTTTSVPSSAAGGASAPTAPASSEVKPPDGAASKPAAEPKSSQGEDTITLSRTEFERRVQSSVDRLMAKHQREEAERRRREERRQLREKDPYAFAQRDREEEVRTEATQQELERIRQANQSMLEAYDSSVLDPLMLAVPESVRSQILTSISDGIPGRGQAATAALKALQEHWKQQGVTEARKLLLTDQAFVKEVLAKYGGQHVEPDLVPAATAHRPAGFSMNSWIRDHGSRVRR